MGFFGLGYVSDEDLLQQLRGGAPGALPVLFDRHYRQVFSLAYRILRDGTEAEELMHEVFLEIYRDAGKFDPASGSVRTWILRCANGRCLSRLQELRLRDRSDERAEACGSLPTGNGGPAR
jgi:RNA polymerase sigma-70 factor (ECF subfamily)